MTEASARYAHLLRPLPRRAVARARPERDVVAVDRATQPRPAAVLVRSARWTWALGGFAVGVAADRLRGDSTDAKTGARLRRAFERIGGTAIKLGQQLAIRVDLLPYDVCRELGRLLDAVPPFDVTYAVARIEAATGRPLHADLTRLDPEPIGSASIACVFQGLLRDGSRVAIKVRRPDIQGRFADDLAVLSVYATLLELITFVRPGFFTRLREELAFMFLEELDFEKEARYQRLFRRFVRRHRIRWLDAPRVHTDLCSADVLVTDYVDGMPCSELLGVVESGDASLTRQLAAMDIDPLKVGLRIWLVSLIGRFEGIFFHGDPHPGNIVVLPGNKLVFLDFGACGLVDVRTSLFTFEIYHRQMLDQSGMANDAGVGLLWPLPHLDVHRLRRQSERSFWNAHDGWRDEKAPWYSQTTASLWLSFLEIVREHRIPVTRDTLRTLRSSLLYDTVAGRLNPSYPVEEFGRYARRAERRLVRHHRRRRDLDDPQRQGMDRAATWARVADAVGQLRQLDRQLDARAFIPMFPSISKIAWTARALMRALQAFVAVPVLVWALLSVRAGEAVAVLDAFGHPVVIVAWAVLFVITSRWILYRLDEPD